MIDRLAPSARCSSLLLFVVIAGVVGGPIASSLQTEGGFVATDRARPAPQARIEAATGVQAAPGVVALMRSPEQAAEVRAQLQAQQASRLRSSEQPTLEPRRQLQAYLLATLRAEAREDVSSPASSERFEAPGRPARRLGLRAASDRRQPSPSDLGRAEMLAFPVLLLLSLLFFRGRATILPLVVGMTTVVGTFLALDGGQPGLPALDLRAQPRDRARPRAGDRLHALPRHPLPRGARAGNPPDAVRTTVRTAGRTVAFSAVTVALALDHADGLPARFLKSMGIAGAAVSLVAGASALVIAPAIFAVWGSKLAGQSRAQRPAQALVPAGARRHAAPAADRARHRAR